MESLPPELFIEVMKIISEDPNVSTAQLSNLQLVSKQFLRNVRSEQGQKILRDRKTKILIYDPFRSNSQIIEFQVFNQDLNIIKKASAITIKTATRYLKKINITLDPPSGETLFYDYVFIGPSNRIVLAKERIYLSADDKNKSADKLKQEYPEILNVFKNEFTEGFKVFVYYDDESKKRVTKIKIISEN
jgi:hypothetical protein